MASRKRAVATEPAPLVYTAQDVARFCEVDLKTIHHWADAGKIPHRRTEGRHLRFRRNDILVFLRSHGFPLPPTITTERPTAFLATQDPALDETAKKLSAKLFVRRFDCAISAIARLVAEQPDALIVLESDPTWTEAAAVALANDPELSWVRLVVATDLARVHLELPRLLDVD